MKLFMGLSFSVFCLMSAGSAQTPPPVPPAFEDIYNTMSADIAGFGATVNAQWDGSSYPVVHSVQLQSANSDLTTNLLLPNFYQVTVLSELNDIQALGAQAVTFHVNFPALYQPYYDDSAEYQAYLNFYLQLVSDIRARGLKIVLENTIAVVYPGNNSSSFLPYYQSLDWPTYQSQRIQLAVNLAQQLQPDYMVLVAEPDTEATATGQVNAGTVAGATQMVQGMLTAIQALGASSIQLGAGCGSWNASFSQFVQSFAALPLQFVDMHIYPVNNNNLPNALNAAALIHAAGKQATISEMWAYKLSDAEAGNISYTTVFARDAFSFWYPLDISFLQVMDNFADYRQFAFISPFWNQNFGAYLDYNTSGSLPDADVIAGESSAAGQAHAVGAFSPTALAYENRILPSPDSAAPLVPAPLALRSASQTVVNLIWTPTRDDVGVAAYNLYRDGALIGAVNSPLSFADQGLLPSTTHSYTIAAFDAAGNMSPQSEPLSVTTFGYPDTLAPSTPQGLVATPFTDTQISLSWLRSTDNVLVTGYEVYRGTSPSTVKPYATTPTNSFLDLQVGPSKGYYYQVDAYDAFNNHSPKSVTAAAAGLPDIYPPATPANVSVTAAAGPRVSVAWSASTDDYMVASYKILRGASPSNLLVISVVASTSLSFTDLRVNSAKTYFYSLQAVDVAKNVSAQSPPIAVTIP